MIKVTTEITDKPTLVKEFKDGLEYLKGLKRIVKDLERKWGHSSGSTN